MKHSDKNRYLDQRLPRSLWLWESSFKYEEIHIWETLLYLEKRWINFFSVFFFIIFKKENEIFFDDQPKLQTQDPNNENNKMLAHLNFQSLKNSFLSSESFSLTPNEQENKEIYLIVRSLKNKDGTAKVFF